MNKRIKSAINKILVIFGISGATIMYNQNLTNTQNVQAESVNKKTSKITKNDKKAIIQVYKELQEALIDKDMKTLNRLLPQKFIAHHITGKTQTRQEWLADIANGKMNYYKYTNYSYKFSRNKNGDVILRVNQDIKAKIYGTKGTWSIPGGGTFRKITGKWIMV